VDKEVLGTIQEDVLVAGGVMATYDDFKKLEFRVAKIREVNDHPNADRLYVITVDLGDRTKQVVAGIKNFYKKEDLVGRSVVVVDNLDPAMLRGVESNGMLLAASDDTGLSIITLDKEIKLGSIVK
jgi:methionyl-tRNA synthetase